MPTIDLRYQAVRHLDDTAIPFIMNSWLRSYRWSDSDNPDYFRETAPQIKKLIKSNRVVLATLAEEPDCFVGWICGNTGVLHYAYVKSAFRRCGVAKDLLEKVCGKSGGIYTHKSHNNAFLRYLDEKGFEHVENDERNKVNLGKESGPRAGVKHAIQVADSGVRQTANHSRTGRDYGILGTTSRFGGVHTDIECHGD